MPDLQALKSKYFIQPPSTPVPATFEDCKITPLIDGKAYFDELDALLSSLGNGVTPADNANQFVYIAGWWLHLLGGDYIPAPGHGDSSQPIIGPTLGLDTPFALDGPSGSKKLIEILKIKAQLGVDIRVLGWISWSVMSRGDAQKQVEDMAAVNTGTLAAIHNLRQEPALAKKCCLNIIGHTAGAVHTKMVIIGKGNQLVGFTGGLDFVGNRHSDHMHTPYSWHDIQAKIEGTAVQGVYDLFKDMWNEVVTRSPKNFRTGKNNVPSVVTGTPTIPAKTVPQVSTGSHHVQSLRTVPRFNYKVVNKFPRASPISFAPNGIFEVEAAWQKAILAAEKYIYMEDQYFWSVDVMKWINQAIKSQASLKVILLTGVADPADPVLPGYQTIAIQDGLLPGLSSAQIKQIAVFGRNTVVHAKTTLIDDEWAIIGSANCIRRSLYTDLEHSIAVIDANNQLVRDYRVDLWGGHFDLAPVVRSVLNNLDHALNIWDSSWGSSGSGVTRPAHFGQVLLPPTKIKLTEKEQEFYDLFDDPDSRSSWGACDT